MRIHKQFAAGILAAALTATSAFAAQVSIDWFPGGSASVGTFWDSQNQPTASFTTFCLEDGEYFYPGVHYNYTVDQDVIQGTGSSLPHYGNPPRVALTQGAVDLVIGYKNQTLGNVSAMDVQNAIWYAQGYLSVSYDQSLGGYAQNHATYDPTSHPGTEVDVLNLYVVNNSDGLDGYNGNPVGARQSFIEVPDGGLTALMLGVGMLGLNWFRRMVR
jgi:hypothetical protein